MGRRTTFRILIALVVALAVLAIFISPQVDSPKTVLRAKYLAQLVLLALVCLAVAFGEILPTLGRSAAVLQASDSAPPTVSSCAERILPLLC